MPNPIILLLIIHQLSPIITNAHIFNGWHSPWRLAWSCFSHDALLNTVGKIVLWIWLTWLMWTVQFFIPDDLVSWFTLLLWLPGHYSESCQYGSLLWMETSLTLNDRPSNPWYWLLLILEVNIITHSRGSINKPLWFVY